MAVADICTALKEDRPYRKSMQKADILAVLVKMVDHNSIDGTVVGVLEKNFSEIEAVCQNEQLSLFGSTPEQWSEDKAKSFIENLILFWNSWTS